MRVRLKLVALLLVLAIMALPAVALAACWAPGGSHACCYGRSQAPARRAQTSSNQPCCQVSSIKPAPVSALQAPVRGASVALPQARAAAVVLLPPAPRAESPETPPAADTSPSQAVLCVFLV